MIDYLINIRYKFNVCYINYTRLCTENNSIINILSKVIKAGDKTEKYWR